MYICVYIIFNQFLSRNNIGSHVVIISVTVVVGVFSFGLIIALVIAGVFIYMRVKAVKTKLEGIDYILLFIVNNR